jgi:uncharacterized protein
MIERLINGQLSTWKEAAGRRPLILRGARQVGKSFTVRHWGRQSFVNTVVLNFEAQPELKPLFREMDSSATLTQLVRIFNAPIEDGKTLLFLDEIQECPEAILALRYIFESRPRLHVIAAGSLIDFVPREQPEKLRVPVGRIEYRYLHPLSFIEFLTAMREQGLIEAFAELSLLQPIPRILHEKALKQFADYLVVGGMPAVVDAYAQSPSGVRYQEIQSSIRQTYRDDFRKYRSRVDIDIIEAAFRSLPRHIARRFKYSELLPDSASKSTRRVLDLFEMARLISKIFASRSNGVPLDSEIDETNYKYILLDVGLINRALQLPPMSLLEWSSELMHSGPLAEQVVGQELIAYTPSFQEPRLHYWEREKQGSNAEVDYVIALDGMVIPIEVKAGTTGRLKSLRAFMEQKKSAVGVRISQHELSLHDGILSVPFYAISKLDKFIREAIKKR